jgi:predicted ATPase
MATLMQGSTLSEQGREHEAIDRMREGLVALDATGTSLVRPHFLILLASALSKVEQNDEALQLLDEAITMVSSNGERYYEAEIYRLKGEVLFKHATPANAEQCFKRSMEIAESQKARSWQLRTAMSLARLYGERGKPQEIYESFTEGFDTGDLSEANALLQKVCKPQSTQKH